MIPDVGQKIQSETMTTGKKSNIAKLTMAGIITILMVVSAEIVLRQIYPVQTGTSFQFRIPHQVFGWVLQPGASYFNEMDEATVHVAYNSKGWRDTEHIFKNPANKSRILVLGDSFMEAYSVDLNDALPKQLERVAKREGADVEVINLGVGGYGTLQEYLVFRELGIKYEADVVLLGFYIDNDVRNNSLVLESIVSQGSLKVNSRPFLDTSDMSEWKIFQVDYEGALRRYLLAKNKERSLGFVQRLEKESAIAKLIQRTVSNIKFGFSTPKNDERKSSISDARSLALFGVNYCNEQPDYTNAWNITKSILYRLNNEISRMGSKLVVFTVPALHEVDPKYMKDAENRISKKGMLCIEEAPAYQRLSGILHELNIEYVDLLPTFRNVTKKGKLNLFRRSDRHWNERGHGLAANHLYSTLVKRKLLTHVDKVNDARQGATPDRFSATLQSGR